MHVLCAAGFLLEGASPSLKQPLCPRMVVWITSVLLVLGCRRRCHRGCSWPLCSDLGTGWASQPRASAHKCSHLLHAFAIR